MKHALRKYLSSSGSALFMVVSTMAALIMLVTAMYMSVVSAAEVQFAVFSQDQATVTASSVGDMVYSYVQKNMSNNTTFMQSLGALKPGESLSTNGNGFAAFGGTAEDDERLGAFDATVTYVYDIDGMQVYDLAVTVENNGSVETSHSFLKISPGQPPNIRRIDNFFTATGYLPTDIWIKKVVTDSQVYFDNEYVKMTNHNIGSASQGMVYNFSMTALGTVEIDLGNDMVASQRPASPLTWAIGNDLIISKADLDIDMAGTSTKHGEVLVRRDMYLEGTQNPINLNTDVYVMGDLHMNLSNSLTVNGNLYVNGNIYLNGSIGGSGNVYVNGKIYNKPKTDPDKAETTLTLNKGTWDNAAALARMNEKLTSSAWPKWTLARNSTEIELDFNEQFVDQNEVKVAYIDQDGTIGKMKNKGQSSKPHVIVIDTGDDPTDIRNLTVEANLKVWEKNGDQDVQVTKNCFVWDPWNGNAKVAVITVGKGTLVLNVPEGVTYQNQQHVFFGHIGWFTACGGRIWKDATGKLRFTDPGDNPDKPNIGDMPDVGATANSYFGKMANDNEWILQKEDLKAHGQTGACDYEKKTTSITMKVQYEKKNLAGEVVKDASGNIEYEYKEETSERIYWTCKKHGGWYDPDDLKDPSGICQEIEDYKAGKADSLCEGRINKDAFDDFWNSDNDFTVTTKDNNGVETTTTVIPNAGTDAEASLKAFFDNYKNGAYSDKSFYYPNVNIYIASDAQNAKIHLGDGEFAGNVVNTMYFGYIYAPYMTYYIKSSGDEGEDTSKGCGGLVVSDIVLGVGSSFIFAQPDISIPGLAGSSWQALDSLADKSWKLSYGLT